MKTRLHTLERRSFIRTAGAATLATIGSPSAYTAIAAAKSQKPESLVKILYQKLDERQRKVVCFPWNHIDKRRGLLRTRIENNWRITKPIIASGFFSKDQQELIRAIFEGMTNPEWHTRFYKQLKDDVGGF